MSQATQSIGDFVRGVHVDRSFTPSHIKEIQRTVIDRYRRECPDQNVDEVFATLSRMNPALFNDHVRADQSQVVNPRLTKLPGASDQQNQDAAERSALGALITLHTRSYPTSDWNEMFATLAKKHADMFSDPNFYPPNSDI